MRILIRRALIVDPLSKHNGKKRDVYIVKGQISEIGRKLDLKADVTFEAPNLHISPGWCDIGTQIGEPGFEHRETIDSAATAAVAGGYTTLAPFPNTHPSLDTRSAIEYVINRGATTAAHFRPIGAITTGAKGNEIAELQDMFEGGAVGFSDGRYPLGHEGIMLIALQYIKKFGGIIINRPFLQDLVAGGQIHESAMSTSLGMRGLPDITEYVMLERDLRLLEYAESNLHVYGISSAESVRLIRDAHRSKLRVTASVAAQNLHFTDDALADFNTNYKVLPPFRAKSDRRELIKGVLNGVITAIVSNHEPYEDEGKRLEFANAEFGSTGLQTAFGMANAALSNTVAIEEIVSCFSAGPRTILGLKQPVIAKGNTAEITLFDPNKEWTVSSSELLSKSGNSAAIGQPMKGIALGTICKGRLNLSGQV